MSSTLTYNDVVFTNVQTLRFDQTAEYDESNTDLLFSRFRIRVAGTVTPDSQHHRVSILSTTLANSTTAMAELHRRLMHPRGVFGFTVGDDVLVAANQTTDVNNGPKPIDCSITQIAGTRAYRVEFEIELALVGCGSGLSLDTGLTFGALENPFVLNNRWSMTEEVDSEWHTVRTVEGLLRVTHISAWPHGMRALCVPPLQKGYRRESMRFIDSPDGLTLRYTIVDRQRHRAAPPSAVDWRGTYTDIADAALGWSEMAVRLTGPPGGDQQALLADAVGVVFARLGNLHKRHAAAGEDDKSAFVLEHMAITESLHENQIDINCRIRHVNAAEPTVINARIEPIGTPLELTGYDPLRWNVPPLLNGSPAQLFAKYWQSPCRPVHGLTGLVEPNTVDTEGTEDDQEPQPIILQSSQPLELDDQGGISQEQRTGFPYTHYEIDSKYVTNWGVLQLPIAVAPSGQDPEEPTETAKLIPIHRGVARRIVVIQAERVGDWPKLPAPSATLTDGNGIEGRLMHSAVAPEAPALAADGRTRLFRLQARYEYGLTRPPTLAESLEPGADPREQGTPEQNRIPGERVFDQQQTIL